MYVNDTTNSDRLGDYKDIKRILLHEGVYLSIRVLKLDFENLEQKKKEVSPEEWQSFLESSKEKWVSRVMVIQRQTLTFTKISSEAYKDSVRAIKDWIKLQAKNKSKKRDEIRQERRNQ